MLISYIFLDGYDADYTQFAKSYLKLRTWMRLWKQ